MLEIQFLDNADVYLADIQIWWVFIGFLFFFIVFYWGMKIIMYIWYAMTSIFIDRNKRYRI